MYKPSFQKREVIVFRQFQRKGWSLFACLGREVVISVLSVATLSATKAAGISDEVWRADSSETTKTVWLGDVGVTGARAPLTQSQAARMVTVLSHDDIAQAPVQSINDLLKMAVGVDVRQRGALGAQTDISIRGGTQEQIAILLNGINICDPQTAHNVLDLPVQLDDIVRIEVLEGPAGRAYGTSSLVGAVNIVTTSARTETRPHPITVQMEGGSFGYAKAAFHTTLPIRGDAPAFSHHVSGSYARSDGYSRCTAGSLNTDYRGSKAFYQGGYDDGQVRLSWHAGIADKGWGSSTFYATPRWQADDQYEHTTKLFTALQAETRQGAVHLRPAIYWNQHRDRYEGYRGQPERMPYNYNRCDVYGISMNCHFDWTAGRTALGAELRNEDLVSSNLGEPLFQTHHIGGTDREYTLGINRTNISAHAEHNVLLNRFTLSAGFVATKSTWSNMNMTIYPGVDASYRLNDHLKLFASYNTSLRLPSFTEMYYKLQGYAADPHLKPEEMQAVEVGAHYLSPVVQAKGTLYHHHGRNMIDWVMDTTQGEEARWQSVNHTRINAFGMEASLAIDFRQLRPRSTGAPQKLQIPLTTAPHITTLSLSYGYITQDKDLAPGMVSQYALEYLRHKLVATAQLHLWRSLDATVSLRWQDRVGTYTDFSGTVQDYRPYMLTDARLTWTARHCQLYVEGNNILDNRSYVDYGNVPQPGAWFVVGIKKLMFL